MDSNNELAIALLDLPDRDFFDLSEELELKLALQLSDVIFSGLAINAPETIDVTEHEQLPIILLSQKTSLRNWAVEFRLNTTVIAVELERGVVFVRHAFPSGRRMDSAEVEKSMSGSRPTGDDATAISSGVEALDIREVCVLPWEQARYAITVITHDWTSNTIMVELKAEEGDATEETEYFFPREQAILLADRIQESSNEPGGLPSFAPSPGTPELENIGAALSIPPEISSNAAQIPVYGAVRMRTPAGAIVESQSSDTAENGDSSETEIPTVVLTGALILAQKDVTERARVDIQIPVYMESAIQPGDIVEGYFGFDLKIHIPELLPGTDCHAYLIIGEHIDGPHRMVISGSEDM